MTQTQDRMFKAQQKQECHKEVTQKLLFEASGVCLFLLLALQMEGKEAQI